MAIAFNHTIVLSREPRESAEHMAELLGLEAPHEFGVFWVVELGNQVELAFMTADDGPIPTQHYAFLVSEAEFDATYGKIRERGLPHWADPQRAEPGEINHNDGGRGVYFEGRDGHFLEILTRPYGSGGWTP